MTSSYARHKGSDQLQASLNDKIDRFVEVYIGRLGKPKLHKKQNIAYNAMSDSDIVPYLKGKIKYLEALDLAKWQDLDNIRAELVETLNQALYLFALT